MSNTKNIDNLNLQCIQIDNAPHLNWNFALKVV